MSPRVNIALRVIRNLLLAALGVAALYIEAQTRAYADGRTGAVEENRDAHPNETASLASEGITLNPGSHVSMRRTPQAVFVEILQGEVLLKAHDPTFPPVVVHAGIAQIRNFNALVCVNRENDRASIEVIAGEARVGNVDAESHIVNEVTLSAGNRVEIFGNAAFGWIRLERIGAGQPCRWGI
jgi:ferric-dicitrate binding protein FerR (iron transport regulator)